MREREANCFEQFEHIAAQCIRRSNSRSHVNEYNTVTRRDNRVYKTVTIQDQKITALFDTGSDLYLMIAVQ